MRNDQIELVLKSLLLEFPATAAKLQTEVATEQAQLKNQWNELKSWERQLAMVKSDQEQQALAALDGREKALRGKQEAFEKEVATTKATLEKRERALAGKEAALEKEAAATRKSFEEFERALRKKEEVLE